MDKIAGLDHHLPLLATAGWADLDDSQRRWVATRLSGTAATDEPTNNPGALRSNQYGSQGRVAQFAAPEEGYRALCSAAKRASFEVGAPLPDDVTLPAELGALLQRADRGDTQAGARATSFLTATVGTLRQTWESLDRMGVGRALLPEARTQANRWRQFRQRWDQGRLGEQGDGGWYRRTGAEIEQLAQGTNGVLRAGLWPEQGPEARRLSEIRKVLAAYRNRFQTAGVTELDELAALDREVKRLSQPVWHTATDLEALSKRASILVGALFEGSEAERIASLKARVATHDQSVAEAWRQFHSDEPYPPTPSVRKDEPELREYIERWMAFKPLKQLEGDLIFHWSGDIEAAELKFNNLLTEFNEIIERQRALRQEKYDAEAVQAVLDGRATPAQRARVEELQKQGKYVPPIEDIESRAPPVAVPPPTPPFWSQFWDSIGSVWTTAPWQVKAGAAAVLGLGALVILRPYAELGAQRSRMRAAQHRWDVLTSRE